MVILVSAFGGKADLAFCGANVAVLRLHLMVSIDKKMIEILNANKSEPRIFHVCERVKRDRQRRGKNDHVNPAARFGSGHAKSSEQRAAESKTEQNDVDDLRRMLFGGPEPQARNFEQVGKHREGLPTCGAKVTLWACPNCRVP